MTIFFLTRADLLFGFDNNSLSRRLELMFGVVNFFWLASVRIPSSAESKCFFPWQFSAQMHERVFGDPVKR